MPPSDADINHGQNNKKSECYAPINSYGYIVGDLECVADLLVNDYDARCPYHVVGGVNGSSAYVRRFTNNATSNPCAPGKGLWEVFIIGDVELTRSIKIPSYNSTTAMLIFDTCDTTLELNGFAIEQVPCDGGPYALMKVGKGYTLTIQDSSENETGYINAVGIAAQVSGSLVLRSGALAVNAMMVYSACAPYANIIWFTDASSSFEMTGGELYTPAIRSIWHNGSRIYTNWANYRHLFDGTPASCRISGGIFSMEPNAAYVVDGYESVKIAESTWRVQAMQSSTFDVTLVAGEAVPVAMPFGKGSVAWREVLADSGLSIGTTVKVPAANGNYAGYSLDANGWQCTTEGITADTVATGDAIWVTLPKDAETKRITLSGSVSAIEQPVVIKEGTNLVCFPTAADVDVNATAIAWTDDDVTTNPHDMDRIETRDLETGKGRVLFYLGDGKWGARASFQCNTGRFCLEWLAC